MKRCGATRSDSFQGFALGKPQLFSILFRSRPELFLQERIHVDHHLIDPRHHHDQMKLQKNIGGVQILGRGGLLHH